MKDRKKVLIVGRTFAPDKTPRAFRTTELANEFARLGHDVTVVLPQNIQCSVERCFKNEFGILFAFYGPLKWKTLQKSRWIGDLWRKIGRLLFLLFEFPNIEIYFKLPAFLKRFKDFDLLISIAVPHENHWAVAKLRGNGHPIAKTWIADCGDPFMTNVLEPIAPPFYFNFLENSFLKHADYVSLPTTGSFEGYNQEYKSKFRVIPQGFSFDNIRLSDTKPEYENPTFAYAGGVSSIGIRSLHPFIATLKAINREFTFHIYSNTAEDVLTNEVDGLRGRIVFHKAIPREKLLFELSTMDFLVNLDNGTNLNTPSKLIDYAICKRPILNLNPFEPNAKEIERFLSGDYSTKHEVGNITKYDIRHVAQQFMNCSKS